MECLLCSVYFYSVSLGSISFHVLFWFYFVSLGGISFMLLGLGGISVYLYKAILYWIWWSSFWIRNKEAKEFTQHSKLCGSLHDTLSYVVHLLVFPCSFWCVYCCSWDRECSKRPSNTKIYETFEIHKVNLHRI